MKIECNLIRDLIPNYIEKLVSNDTKEYIEKHIESCSECKKIMEEIVNEKMQEEKNISKTEKEEINYLKKYKKKKQMLKVIIYFFIGIIILIIAFGTIKFNYVTTIIDNSYQKGEKLKQLNNYNLNITEHCINYKENEEYFFYSKYYYKDNKYKIVNYTESRYTELMNSDTVYYGDINSNKQIQISDENKKITNIVSNYSLKSKGDEISKIYTYLKIYANDLNLAVNIALRTSFQIRTERFNGRECYVLKNSHKTNYHEIWIDKEEKLPIREIDEIYGVQYIEKWYSIYKDVVSNVELEIPQKEGYTIENIEDKAFYENWKVFHK